MLKITIVLESQLPVAIELTCFVVRAGHLAEPNAGKPRFDWSDLVIKRFCLAIQVVEDPVMPGFAAYIEERDVVVSLAVMAVGLVKVRA